MSIVIFSRPIRTGKTTELLSWCNRQNNIAGVLMPEMEGKRKILNFATKEIYEIECTDPANTEKELIRVGRFYFYADIFDQVNAILSKTPISSPGWIVIDEVGKLELAGRGFYVPVKELIRASQNNDLNSALLLVVRQNLLNETLAFFKIENYRLIHSLEGFSPLSRNDNHSVK